MPLSRFHNNSIKPSNCKLSTICTINTKFVLLIRSKSYQPLTSINVNYKADDKIRKFLRKVDYSSLTSEKLDRYSISTRNRLEGFTFDC